MKRTYSDSPTALFCALETAVRTGNESAARKLRAQLAALGVVVEWRRPSHPTAVDALISDLARVTKERDVAVQELKNIAGATPWKGPHKWTEDFQDWAISRARHALEKIESEMKGGGA